VFGRQDAGEGAKSLSDFPTDVVTHASAKLGIDAASVKREA
jgi:hypothetical protein